jgi:hypothetical protein
MATGWCEQRGYDTTIVVPADIPLITSDELQRVLDAAPEEGAVFVPAYDRRGSNCILRRPASIIPLRFGNDSFLPHCAAMKRTGKDLIILELAGMGLDIDNPHELELLVQRDGETNAQRLLRSWGFRSARSRRLGGSSVTIRRQVALRNRGSRAPRDSGARHSRRLRRRLHRRSFGRCTGIGRFAVARGRHPGHQTQDCLQGGRSQRRLGFGQAVRSSSKFAARNGADARVVELALREAKRVVRKKHVLITETQHGFVCANSGVDVSNVDGGKTAVLLPVDPDRSAAQIHRKLKKRTGLHIPRDHR